MNEVTSVLGHIVLFVTLSVGAFLFLETYFDKKWQTSTRLKIRLASLISVTLSIGLITTGHWLDGTVNSAIPLTILAGMSSIGTFILIGYMIKK